jgi:hypothetical protein
MLIHIQERGRDDLNRYGMKSDDWRHLDAYWREMYREEYPRGEDLTGSPTDDSRDVIERQPERRAA